MCAMSQPTYDRLVTHLDRLGLSRAKDLLPEVLKAAEQNADGHAAVLDRLLEEEVAAREERRIKGALRLAGFPFVRTLDAFDFAFQPSLDRAQVLDLASLAFLARKENVLLLGPPRVGKSHLAVALAICACQNGASVYFTTLDAMIRRLAAADRVGKLDQKLRTYTTKSQLLVVDEVGYLPLSRTEANYLFQVVSASLRALQRDPDLEQVGHRVAGGVRRPRHRHRHPRPPAAPQPRALDQGQQLPAPRTRPGRRPQPRTPAGCGRVTMTSASSHLEIWLPGPSWAAALTHPTHKGRLLTLQHPPAAHPAPAGVVHSSMAILVNFSMSVDS